MIHINIKRMVFLSVVLLLIVFPVGAWSFPWYQNGNAWAAVNGSYTLWMWNNTSGSNVFTIPVGITKLDYFIVAGGGSGGGSNGPSSSGSGGGAGGLLDGNFSVLPGSPYTVVVGDGGLGVSGANGLQGANSSVSNASFGLNAMGGGYGVIGAVPNLGGNGGSGGGAMGEYNSGTNGGTGYPGQGNQGGSSGGVPSYCPGSGGGSGAVGTAGGDGGIGNTTKIFWDGVSYFSGGGGVSQNQYECAWSSGGNGGGGYGANSTTLIGGAGTTGTGGGGGGSYSVNTPGGKGGSGVVILRYQSNFPIVSVTSNVTKGVPPLSVQFNDTSITSPTGWNWSYTSLTPGNNTQIWWSTTRNATNVFGLGNWKINVNVTNATGYTNSIIPLYISAGPSGAFSGWNRQDIIIAPLYLLTVTVKDSSSQAVIPVCNIADTFGQNVTTTNGVGVLTYTNSSLITLFISSAGYVSKSQTYSLDSSKSVIVYLSPQLANPNNTQNTWWTPHTVQITLMDDTYANRLTNVNLTAHYNQSSMPTAWVSQLYGIQSTPAADMVNSALILGGTTGSDGTLTATMLGSLKYDITLNSAAYGLVDYNVSAYPSDPMLNIYVPTNLAPSFTNTSNSVYSQLNGTTVYATEPDLYNVSMCIKYVDTAGLTSSVNETWLYANNNTVIFNQVVASPGNGVNLTCITKPNVRGMQVWWGYNASRQV